MKLIPMAEPVIGRLEKSYVADAVDSGWVSSIGPYIERFEQEFARYIGVSHAITVSNGTVGLHLALHALGIGPGDEVLIPDLTFVATAHAVLQTGAIPVFVDVKPDTWCMDIHAARRAVSSHTKAIIPVHIYGHPTDMNAVNALAQEHSLLVIEDAAEAHGAEVNGQRVGSLGYVGVFSFYGNKIITTGEGGIMTTNDAVLAERLRYLKGHGMSPKRRYYHTELAFNYRMTNLQAALGLAQLEQIEIFIEKKRTIYSWYAEVLCQSPHLQLPVERSCYRNVYWMFNIVLNPSVDVNRDALAQELRRQGIDCRRFFVPMHRLPHLAHYRTVGKEQNACPQADRLGERGLTLPSGYGLDRETVLRIADIVRNIVDGKP